MSGWNDDDLDAIAAEPMRARAALDFAVVARVCSRGVRSALDMVRRDRHESALMRLTEHVRGLEATDPASTTVDAWARLGAVAGALDMWQGRPSPMPRDCPSTDHALAYSMAWACAGFCVAMAYMWGVR